LDLSQKIIVVKERGWRFFQTAEARILSPILKELILEMVGRPVDGHYTLLAGWLVRVK
jgi:hypothetical protein